MSNEICQKCKGTGKLPFYIQVTKEMARDAGQPEREGSWYHWDDDWCDGCAGTGVAPKVEEE